MLKLRVSNNAGRTPKTCQKFLKAKQGYKNIECTMHLHLLVKTYVALPYLLLFSALAAKHDTNPAKKL